MRVNIDFYYDKEEAHEESLKGRGQAQEREREAGERERGEES